MHARSSRRIDPPRLGTPVSIIAERNTVSLTLLVRGAEWKLARSERRNSCNARGKALGAQFGLKHDERACARLVVSLSLTKLDTSEISIPAGAAECFRCNARQSSRYRVASLLDQNQRGHAELRARLSNLRTVTTHANARIAGLGDKAEGRNRVALLLNLRSRARRRIVRGVTGCSPSRRLYARVGRRGIN